MTCHRHNHTWHTSDKLDWGDSKISSDKTTFFLHCYYVRVENTFGTKAYVGTVHVMHKACVYVKTLLFSLPVCVFVFFSNTESTFAFPCFTFTREIQSVRLSVGIRQ